MSVVYILYGYINNNNEEDRPNVYVWHIQGWHDGNIDQTSGTDPGFLEKGWHTVRLKEQAGAPGVPPPWKGFEGTTLNALPGIFQPDIL